MAYMSQEKKQEIAPQVKAVLKKYGMKGSISVHHHSTLVVTLTAGKLDIIKNYNDVVDSERCGDKDLLCGTYIQVNEYHIDRSYTGKVKNFLLELKNAMNGRGSKIANHDNSDIMTDYFDVGWYIDINVGKWDKPYVLVK